MSLDNSKIIKAIPLRRITSDLPVEKFHKLGYFYKPNSITNISRHNTESDKFLLKKDINHLKAYEFHSVFDESEEDIINLLRSLKKLKTVDQIRILFRKCNVLTDDLFQQMMKILSCKKSTNFFKLRLISATKLSDKGLYQIGKYFLKQKTITKLDGFFYSMPQLNDIAFYNLGRHIRRLHNLQDLELYFGSFGDKWKYITFTGIHGFIDHISRLRRIQRLSLTINSFDNFDDKCLFSFEECLSRLKNLKSLELIFRYVTASEIGVMKISQLIRKLLDLKELKLEFRHCYEPSHKTLLSFSDSIQMLTELKTFGVHFENCMGIRSQTLVYLTEKLSKLEKLKRTTLNFVTCGNITTIDFHPDFMKNLSDFEEFNINFSGNPRINKVNITKFLQSLDLKNVKRSLIKLDELNRGEINFMGSLNNMILNATNLTELSLSLRGYEDLKREDLKGLFDTVTKIRGIKIFKLDISEGPDEIKPYLAEAKSQLNNLEEVSLIC